MKVYLHSDFKNQIAKSGVGRASVHQALALESAGIDYTFDPSKEYDIAHINTTFPQSQRFAQQALKKGKAVIYHAHSTEEDFRNSFLFSNLASKIFKKWLIHCYKTSHLVITPTTYSKSLLSNYKLDRPIEVISNGIDLDYWRADVEEIKHFKQKYLPYNKHRPIAMSVGLQIERKGIIEFIELAKRLPGADFIWFGYSDPKKLPLHVRKALNTSLPNLFFPGYISRDELRVAYQAVDCFLFMTHEETEGIVLLEALASYTPTIVRDIPVFDYLEDGKHLYKARDLDDFEVLARKLFSQELIDIRKDGYEVAEERSIEKIGQQYIDIYEQALILSNG